MARFLGIDYGDVRIGVALSDPTALIASPLAFIQNDKIDSVLLKLRSLVDEYQITCIVIGLPKNMNGTLGERSQKTMGFAEACRQAVPTQIELWDERLTSVQANKVLLQADVSRKKRKKVIDSMAAQLLLQSYLDSLP